MEKFDTKTHMHLVNNLPFSYVSLPLYLDFLAYTFKRNDEDLIVTQDHCYLHDFPSLFLPKNKDNWTRASMSMITIEEVEKIKNENIEIGSYNPTETEYFYKTSDFIDPKNKMKSRINQFAKNYNYKILNSYSKKKLVEFYNLWEGQKERSSDLFEQESTDLFFFCLENLDKYNIKQVYVESDDKLVGFAWGVAHLDRNWIGIHMKVDYSYKGLSRFLHCERAKMFSDRDLFSLGTGCHDPGLIRFKEELKPIFKKQYYYIFTRDKK